MFVYIKRINSLWIKDFNNACVVPLVIDDETLNEVSNLSQYHQQQHDMIQPMLSVNTSWLPIWVEN